MNSEKLKKKWQDPRYREHMKKAHIGQKAWNKGKKLSQTHIENLQKSHVGNPGYWKGKNRPKMAGKNNCNWKGGVTSINETIRKSVEYKLWREAVFKRDNYTCIWCGIKSKKGVKVYLHADHIKPFAYFPELRFSIDNGRTLCVDCHRKTDTFGWLAYNYYAR